jgi:large subunit ribosomal protein L6e
MVKWYPTEDVQAPKKKGPKPVTPLKGSITPGQVLILLAGKHQGKRVVFLKQLESGLLLVTGPYKLNGVPLKRIPQSYTIPTSTKVDISKSDFSSILDTYFAKEKVKVNKSEEAFFTVKKEKKSFSEAKKVVQSQVDAGVLTNLKDVLVKKYLKTKFKLRNGMFPHALKF